MSWVLSILLNALALVLADYLLDSVQIAGFFSALLAGLVLGLVNTFIRPVLILLTLPLTFFSLGLFIFFINALTFAATSWLVPGFDVLSFWGAFWGALLTSIIGWFLSLVFGSHRGR